MLRTFWRWWAGSVSKTSRSRQRAQPRRARGLLLEALETRDLLASFNPAYAFVPSSGWGAAPATSAGATGVTPAQIRQAYGFNQISFNSGTVAGNGSGETIAIVDAYDDPDIAGDLHQFDQAFGLPDPVFTKVNETGGTTLPPANAGWAREIALDVEWSHAIAPKANILLVEANDNTDINLFAAVRYAAKQPDVAVVSMSFDGSEFGSELSDDNVFQTPAGHAGVTFVAATGDSGAPPSYPASSPNVLAVGGTTLQLDSSGNILSETAWGGSGGGISAYESQPAYQKNTATGSSTMRTIPDVAYDANPGTGFPIYDTYNDPASAPWSQFGGTSAGAPQWAALIAIADQGRALAGLSSLDGPSQTLPMLYSLPAGDFHDVTSGTSTGSPNYSAKPGYDLVTGRGSPIANKIVAALVGPAAPAPVVTHFRLSAPASTLTGTAFSVTVTALDANGNVVTGYTGTVHFTSTDPSGILPADYQFTSGDQGSHTFTITLKSIGTQTVAARDASNGFANGSVGVTINQPAVTHFLIAAPTTTLSGVAIAITVTALDANGNTVAGYRGTVHFTSSDSSAVLPANYTFTSSDNGSHTFLVIMKAVGNDTIGVLDVSNSLINGGVAVAVSAAAGNVELEQQPSAIAAAASPSSNVNVVIPCERRVFPLLNIPPSSAKQMHFSSVVCRNARLTEPLTAFVVAASNICRHGMCVVPGHDPHILE